jgi:hypothetical protein
VLRRCVFAFVAAFASASLASAQELATATPLLDQISYDAAVDVEAAAADACACDACSTCCECESCCGCDDLCCTPLWTVKAGAVILARARQSGVFFEDSTSGAVLAGAGALGTAWSGGPDITIRRRLGDRGAAEVRYFSVDGWSSDASYEFSGFWQLPTTPPIAGQGPIGINAASRARLFSTEINLRRQTNNWLTLLAGFRWIELHENLDLSAQDGSGALTNNTDNHLYGAQIGGDLLLWDRGGPFRVESILKAGIFGNSADNSARLVTQQGGPAFAIDSRQSQVAFVGEIGATGVYQMTPHLALRGGYQLLWIEGVAVASDQISSIDALTGNAINTGGGEFFHGALCSLDFTW